MQLDIKNDEVRRLARDLTDLTGETPTVAVARSLELRLQHVRKQRRQDRTGISENLLALAEECASLPVIDARSGDEMLYDDEGKPRPRDDAGHGA